jgi:hypothetical protein
MLAMRFYASLSWLFAMFFWPLLLFQAYRLRQSRPPRAYSWVHDSGSTPAKFSDMLSVTVIGGASVASDEIKDPQAALGPQFAENMHLYCRKSIHWQSFGRKQLSVGTVERKLGQLKDIADILVIIVGSHECSRLHAVGVFRGMVDFFVTRTLRQFPGMHIVLAGIPAFEKFPGLPFPLKYHIGLRARAFDAVLRNTAKCNPRTIFIPLPTPGAVHFSGQGLHLGRSGIKLVSDYLARHVCRQLKGKNAL